MVEKGWGGAAKTERPNVKLNQCVAMGPPLPREYARSERLRYLELPEGMGAGGRKRGEW